MEQPFLEHPIGQTALEAMEHAIPRLRALPEWKQWIAFSAQGAGPSDESVHCAELRLLQDELDAGGSVNVTEITTLATVNGECFVLKGPLYSIAAAAPVEAARVLDVLFAIISAFDRSRTRMTMRLVPNGSDWTGTPSPVRE